MTDVLERFIQRQIGEARSLYTQFGRALSLDPEISELLRSYRQSISRTGEWMRRVGVVNGCTACASEGRGSCCFPGIEEGYDHISLLINLLLGCDLPDAREFEGSCFFVGDKGCKLCGRYYFCLHYLCPGLQDMLGPSRSGDLLRVVGEELEIGWRLEQALRRWLDDRNRDSIKAVEEGD